MNILTVQSPELKPLLDAIGIKLNDTMRVVITIEARSVVTVNVEMALKDLAGREVFELMESYCLVKRQEKKTEAA